MSTTTKEKLTPPRSGASTTNPSQSSQTLRVLFITRAYSPNAGGMERLSFEMIQALSSHPSIEATIIAHQAQRQSAPLFIFTSLFKALAASRRVDVVHLGDPLLSLTGYLIKSLTGRPVTITVHGLDVLYPNLFYRLYLWFFFRKLDLYLPISTHVAKLLEKTVKAPPDAGVSNVNGQWSNVIVINPGIHDEYHNPDITRRDLDTLLGKQTANQTVFLTAGRLIDRKGQEWFVRNVLPKLPPNTLYVLAGTGPASVAIRQATRSHQLDNQVIMLGRTDPGHLKVLYNTIDAFVQPNISLPNDAEGFGLVLLEAALCERPVFAAQTEGLVDAIQNGHNGTLLPSANPQAWIKALTTFSQNPQQITPLGSAARQYTLTNFGWSKQATMYLTALQSLAAAKH